MEVGHMKKNGRQPTYKINIGFYFFKTLFSKVACTLWCSWTLAVNMKYTCFIFEYVEAGGIWLPLWALIGVVVTHCRSPWVLFPPLLFRPKRLTNGGQWCSRLLKLVPRVFSSPTDHLWGKRKENIEGALILIFLSLKSSTCFSVKLEFYFQRK